MSAKMHATEAKAKAMQSVALAAITAQCITSTRLKTIEPKSLNQNITSL